MFNIEYQPPAPPNPLTATTERNIFFTTFRAHILQLCPKFGKVLIPYKFPGDHLLWNGRGGSYVGLSHDYSDIDE